MDTFPSLEIEKKQQQQQNETNKQQQQWSNYILIEQEMKIISF